MLDDVGTHVEEVALVLDRDQRTLGAIIPGNLQWLREGTQGFDITLNAHVAEDQQEKVNIIKRREQYRPFAASGLKEHTHTMFDVPEKAHASPFMNFCFRVKKNKRQDIAAIVHKDNTCRIQTVSPDNGRYYKLIRKFYELTGTPCILNTSYNLKGEPIVESPEQAIEDFRKTKMDYLVIEDCLISKH